MRLQNTSDGFSLLEILIAVSILASSFVVLLGAQGSALLSSERADRLTMATNLARQKMAEIEMGLEKDLAKNKFPGDDKQEKGEFEEPFDDFRWSSHIHKVEIPLAGGGDEAANPAMLAYIKTVMDKISKAVRAVNVTIYWGDKDLPIEDQPQMTVTTHIVKLK